MSTKYFDWTFNPSGWLGHFAGGNLNTRTLGYVYVDEVPGSNGGDDAIGAQIVSLQMISGQVRRRFGGDDDLDIRYTILMRNTSNSLVSSGRTSSTPPSSGAQGHYVQLPQDGTTTILDPAQGEGGYMAFPWITTPRSGSYFHSSSTTAAGIQLQATQYYANNMGGDDDLAEHGAYVFRFGYIPNKTTITASGIFVPANFVSSGEAIVSSADVFGSGNLQPEPATLDAGPPLSLTRVAEGELLPSWETHRRSWFRSYAYAPENWSFLNGASTAKQPESGSVIRYVYDAIPDGGQPAGPFTWRQDLNLDNWIEGMDIIFGYDRARFRKWYAGDHIIDSGLNQIRLQILDSTKTVLTTIFDEDAETNIAQGAVTTSGYVYRDDFEVRFPSPSRTTYPDAKYLRYEIVSGANIVSASFSRCLWAIEKPYLSTEYSTQFIAFGFGTSFEGNSWWADVAGYPVQFKTGRAGPSWRRIADNFEFNAMAALPDPHYASAATEDQKGIFNPAWNNPWKIYWTPIPGDTNGPGGDIGAGPGQPLQEIFETSTRHKFKVRGYSAVGLGSAFVDDLNLYQDYQVGVDVEVGELLCWTGNFENITGTDQPTYELWGINDPSDTPRTGTLIKYWAHGISTSYQRKPELEVPDGFPWVRFNIRQYRAARFETRDYQFRVTRVDTTKGVRISPWQHEDGSRAGVTTSTGGTQQWAGGFEEYNKSGFWAQVSITELQGAQGSGVLLAGAGTIVGDASRVISADPIVLVSGLASMLGTAGLVLTGAGVLIALAATGAIAWGSAYRAKRVVRQTTKIKAGEATTSGSGTVS